MINKNTFLFGILFFILINTAFAQKTGYPVDEYLSQINISDVSISPNGKYVAVITINDNFEKNKTEKRLWQYEISEEGSVISKTEIPIYKHTVSQLRWTKDSNFLLFRSKDSISKSLFKIETTNPKIITPVLKEPKKLKGLSSYAILDTNQILFYEKFSLTKIKKDSISIRFPKEKVQKHSVFKSFDFGSETIDSLFTIQANVSYFEISPDKEKIIYSNYEPTDFYSTDAYADAHTYIINKDGSSVKQLTNDRVRDYSWWLTNDTVISLFYGNPNSNVYNIAYDQLYSFNLVENKKEKLVKSFDGRIRNVIPWKDQKLLINADYSTSSHLFLKSGKEFKKVSSSKGTISNFISNRNKNLMAFSMVRNDAFEEVYIARSIEELENPIKITDFNQKLTAYKKPEIEKIIWKNSTGEIIEGVLMWPPGKKNVKNLPLAVDIHGGPWSSRSEAITLSGVQYYYFGSLLASRGFLVLLPNYSGGTGRGQAFTDAINGVPRTKPTDDILTGVQYLIAQKWVDKSRMIVKGASYGGLLTNSIIGETNMFKAALSSCGVWDEIAGLGVGDGDTSEFIRFKGVKIWEDSKLYRKESPIYNATKITTPTLITHGEKDVRVPTLQAYDMYYTLKELGVPTELLIYKGEGHIYKKPASKIAKVKAELDFIAKYIKL